MDDAESPGLGLDLPEAPPPAAGASPYRVLARKYRPQTFAELIGQDAMVQTLANAIEREKRLKKWNRAWKVRLVEDTNPNWDDLYPSIAAP